MHNLTSLPPGRIKWAVPICIFIAALHVLFVLSYWPGILGPDSIAVLQEAEGRNHHGSGKSAFWVYFIQALYTPWQRIEIPTIALAIVSTFVFCRICTYLIDKKHYKSLIFCLLFICCAPQIIAMNIALYPDGVFATAFAGMLF